MTAGEVIAVADVAARVMQIVSPLFQGALTYAMGGQRPEYLNHLPDTMQSELELVRLEERSRRRKS